MGHDRSDQHRPTTDAAPNGVVVPMPIRRQADPGGGPGDGRAPAPGDGAFTIDCADCSHRHSHVCDDCVVSFIVDREPDDALVVDADEARAVRLLAGAGLLPGVRHQARASGQ